MPDICNYPGCTAEAKMTRTLTEGDTYMVDAVCYEHAVALAIIAEIPTFDQPETT